MNFLPVQQHTKYNWGGLLKSIKLMNCSDTLQGISFL